MAILLFSPNPVRIRDLVIFQPAGFQILQKSLKSGPALVLDLRSRIRISGWVENASSLVKILKLGLLSRNRFG